MELLLKAGAPVQAQDQQGGTPVDWAQRFGQQEAVQLLLEARAEVNPNSTGALALFSRLQWARRARPRPNAC